MCLSTPLPVLAAAVGGPGPAVVGPGVVELNEAREGNTGSFCRRVQVGSVMLGYCTKWLVPD